MPNLPGVSRALRADVLTELGELLPALQDATAKAMSDHMRTDLDRTMYETVEMVDTRTDLANAYRALADAATAYRAAVRKAIDHLESTR